MKLYVCYEPEDRGLAKRLDAWTWVNSDCDDYDRRLDIDVESAEAAAIKTTLRSQIWSADVTVCIISQGTFANRWIAWELTESRSGKQPNGLVGILLHEGDTRPPAMSECGAIFVPFLRDKVERAIAWAAENRGGEEDFMLADE